MNTTFFVNFSVFMSTNSARTAFTYDLKLSNVTRPEPIGYLFLSVSIPGMKLNNNQRRELNYRPLFSEKTTYQRTTHPQISHSLHEIIFQRSLSHEGHPRRQFYGVQVSE